MGVCVNLFKDGKYFAALGRTHNYQSDYETADELIAYLLTSVLRYQKADTRDVDSAGEASEQLSGDIRYAIDEAIKTGRADVLSELQDEGIEVRHE